LINAAPDPGAALAPDPSDKPAAGARTSAADPQAATDASEQKPAAKRRPRPRPTQQRQQPFGFFGFFR
jgi:hypothetical protein